MTYKTPEDRVQEITGVRDYGGPCTSNSKLGHARAIARAIREAEQAMQERCAKMVETGVVSAGGSFVNRHAEVVAAAIRGLK